MALAKDIGALKRDISKHIADEVFKKSQENIVDMGISDTGNLLITGEVKYFQNYAQIIYPAPYAEAVNSGTRPHAINPEWIEGWVKRKLGKSEKQAKRIAKLIAFKIQRYGTKPQPFFDNAIEFVKNSK